MLNTKAQIAEANDKFRKSLHPDARHKVILTPGVADHPQLNQILEQVRNFDTFTSGNNSHGEHDFGQIIIDTEKFFWKIDYYDLNFDMGVDPMEEECARLLTIMLASEY